jgi:hypothetical protein
VTIQSTLLLSTLFAAIAAIIYAYVGWRLNKRLISSAESKLAWQFFVLWWYGLAVTTLIGGFLNLLGAFGMTDLPVFVTATFINIQLSCVALLGLFYYLIYLFTGNSRWLPRLATMYFVFYVLILYQITASGPESVSVDRWSTTLSYRVPLTGPLITILIVWLFASQIFGGIAYFTIYFRVPDATQKYRILLVSWSIICWFITPFIGLAGGLQEQDWWQIVSRLIGLAATLMILMAYFPPGWLKERYSLISLTDEN